VVTNTSSKKTLARSFFCAATCFRAKTNGAEVRAAASMKITDSASRETCLRRTNIFRSSHSPFVSPSHQRRKRLLVYGGRAGTNLPPKHQRTGLLSSSPSGDPVVRQSDKSTFDCSGRQAFNDPVLENHDQNYERDGDDHGTGHNRSPRLFEGTGAAELRDDDRDRLHRVRYGEGKGE